MKLLYSNDQPGIHAPSWYSAHTEMPRFEQLDTPIDTETCIVGGGYTGLAAARELAAAGHSVVLLEAHRVGWGASGRNGGQLGTGFNQTQQTLTAQFGDTRARQLWALAEEGKAMVHEIGARPGVELRYQPGVIHALHRRRFVKHARAEADWLGQHYDYPHLEWLDRQRVQALTGSDGYHAGVLDRGAGHLNALALAGGLADAARGSGASIFERSEVLSIQQAARPATGVAVELTTSLARVRAKRVIVACNGYLDRLLPAFDGLIMPINNFIVVTRPLESLAQQLLPGNHAVADSRFVVNYFRRLPGERLLFGGGESYGYCFPADLERRAYRAMLEVFPKLEGVRLDHAWGGTLAISRSRLPVVRRLSASMMASGGYSGHGVALALITGRVMAEAVLGNEERLGWLSSIPARPFPGGVRARPLLLAGAMTVSSWLDRV